MDLRIVHPTRPVVRRTGRVFCPIRLIPFLLLFFLLPGSLWAFWPVYWELDGQKNMIGPLISYDDQDGKTHLTVRPFLSAYDSPRDYTLLFPLGKSTAEKGYFFPIYTRRDSEEGHNVALFPLFFGRTEDDRPYGGVFPFYGKLYDRYKRDEIGFFLWPLYGYSKSEGATKTNVLWPFFSFYSGSQEGFKIGPLYGQRRWGNSRRSTFFLWPFFIHDEKGLDTDNPIESYWAMPFYMQTKSPRSSYYAVFWPIFTYSRMDDRTRLNAPWPLFSYATGGDEHDFGVWPLYFYSRTEKDESTTILWPVYKRTEQHLVDTDWTETRILLLDRYARDNRGTFLNVWPFFEYRSAGGNRDFFFPSLFPWRNKGYDRIVRPMLTLVEYRQTEEKVVSNVLYGLYTKEQKGDTWKRRFAFLFEIKREADGMGFQLLSGLFAVDARRIKLLYIPIGRTPKGPAAGKEEEKQASAPMSEAGMAEGEQWRE